jgi:hypothetical protein
MKKELEKTYDPSKTEKESIFSIVEIMLMI